LKFNAQLVLKDTSTNRLVIEEILISSAPQKALKRCEDRVFFDTSCEWRNTRRPVYIDAHRNERKTKAL